MLTPPVKALFQYIAPADTTDPWVQKPQLKHHKIQIQGCDFVLTVTLTRIEARERAGRQRNPNSTLSSVDTGCKKGSQPAEPERHSGENEQLIIALLPVCKSGGVGSPLTAIRGPSAGVSSEILHTNVHL